MEHNAIRLSEVNFCTGFWHFKKNRITGSPERQKRVRSVNALRLAPAEAAARGVYTFGKTCVYRQCTVRFDQAISTACRECIGEIEDALHSFSSISEIAAFQIGIGFKR
jgi:hypothetical protein